jgi:hypothetical protein
MQAKAAKDVAQAIEVIEVLLDDRAGDLGLAWEALVGRGTRWQKAARRGVQLLAAHNAVVHRRLTRLLETGEAPIPARKRTKPSVR